mmetsp:Transcript_42341/g.126933  ORF Transcript_42341/g.126933 Transcript_42341/m.126933 type:complete len:223 (-) Transcript_42341:363-1031(-)
MEGVTVDPSGAVTGGGCWSAAVSAAPCDHSTTSAGVASTSGPWLSGSMIGVGQPRTTASTTVRSNLNGGRPLGLSPMSTVGLTACTALSRSPAMAPLWQNGSLDHSSVLLSPRCLVMRPCASTSQMRALTSTAIPPQHSAIAAAKRSATAGPVSSSHDSMKVWSASDAECERRMPVSTAARTAAAVPDSSLARQGKSARYTPASCFVFSQVMSSKWTSTVLP